MSIAARIREMLDEQRDDIRDSIEGLVAGISEQLDDEGNLPPDGADAEILSALKDLLADGSLIRKRTPREQCEFRAVTVNIVATMTVDAESVEHLEDQMDNIKSGALNFGCDSVSVTGDYASSPVSTDVTDGDDDEDSGW